MTSCSGDCCTDSDYLEQPSNGSNPISLGTNPICLYQGQSEVTAVLFGVTQGSVLGPLYFLLYTSEIFALVREFGFRVHGYAEDLQICDHVDQRQSSDVIVRFSLCVDAIKDWMARHRPCLNPSETEIIWLGSARSVRGLPVDPVLISGSWITPSKQVCDLGVIIDSELTMISHVNTFVVVVIVVIVVVVVVVVVVIIIIIIIYFKNVNLSTLS